MAKQMGNDVTLKHAQFGNVELHNVTEIHYCYPDILGKQRIAFESDIHTTGITYDVTDVLEFEAKSADKIHESF